jgi:hypothetical protein
MNNASLVILEQTSLAEEKFFRNGIQKNVHIVVKNLPFYIRLGFNEDKKLNYKLDFNLITIDLQLMYDCDGERCVDFVKNKPIEYKGTINDRGDKMTLEVRIKILSSHLEDMFFNLRIRAHDSVTKQEIPSMFVTTHPIKVVSKPEQVARIKQGQAGKKTRNPKKRSLNEMMCETVEKIERQQAQQQLLLEKLYNHAFSNTADPLQLLFSSTKSMCSVDQPSENSNSLESALQNLVTAYESTPAGERPAKIRKFCQVSTTSTLGSVSEIINHLEYAATRDMSFFRSESGADLPMLNDPARIDDLYCELLFSS